MHQEVSHFYSFLPNRVAGNGGLLEEPWLAESKGLGMAGWRWGSCRPGLAPPFRGAWSPCSRAGGYCGCFADVL